MSEIKITKEELLARLSEIKMIVMDVDGTLTDGQITIDDNGIETKSFNVKDGMGIKMLREAGFKIAIISARYSKAVEIRAKELKVVGLFQNATNKIEALHELLAEHHISSSNVIYIGDDNNDILIARTAGISFAVNDASDALKQNVDIVLKSQGGRGAIREAAELILNLLEMRKQDG
ncbi:KdsC family phosphatase [Paenibacillus oleatilyticus]|uniref:KdsC family phosphatase n=1 Tax=Paenibacillus oleatilyticus TaxID=2594886 RepID=A0ABV4V4X1_9BACL